MYEKQNELAKRLDSLGSAFGSQRTLQQQFPSVGLDNVQFASDDLMRRFRQQQQMWMQRQGLGNGAAPKIVNGEEGKPFRCPVIGCEKAYKNQNGMR